ncbi:gephyrin-like molybdotransferase Glp [Asticcacaulis sp. YBE204]|uniref:molybdopterin molybdotransferase MoeA n=1 Tax=Asticcacaulis sp. YBE204 TaxID=1282363 RepID=UPI0003C3DFDE|nr:gephyrin-like molybdotransferase Glp [Asticcacaulis sp. YBE204]ESQ81123.1 molybdenum cofactor biosynthesis protein [Asticcacaulis sp. YBE204]
MTRKGISVDEAQAFLREVAPAPLPRKVALRKALGRVLTAPVVATRDQPPFDASAMDGYAICKSLTDPVAQSTPLKLIGESVAGKRFEGRVEWGQCVRIFTGAPVPDGAKAVVIQENAKILENGATDHGIFIEADGWNDPKTHIRPRGQDFKAGHELLSAGLRLDPWRLSLAAAAGRKSVTVARRPRIAILSTGDELVAPGDEPRADQIFESGSFALMALCRQWGAKAEFLGVESDDLDGIHDAVKACEADLIVTIGGASVGDYDLVKPALERLGLALDFSSINIRPGKPTWTGILASERRVLGLPGNPASAMVCAQLFLKPWIEAALGQAVPKALASLPVATTLAANGPRETFLRGRIVADASGQPSLKPFADQDSSLIAVFSQSDALIRRSANAPMLPAGDVAEYVRLDRY